MATRKNTPKKPPRKKTVRRKTRNHNDIITFLLVIAGFVTLSIGSGLAWFLALDIPDIRSVDDYQPLVATTLLDHRGNIIDAIYEQNRIVLAYEEMQPLIPKAFVAAEDGRYWEHGGLDAWSIARAFINNIKSGRRSQGGSTITQQVTRALMLSPEKNYFRKVKEAVLAYRLDKMLSKEDILSIYLNEIYLGEGAYGVEAAARTYFGKPSSRLNLAEIALLAGLPQSPSRYSPVKHFQRAQARQRYVLNRMAEEGIITPESARQAYTLRLNIHDRSTLKQQTGYFTQYVRSQLEQRFGARQLLHAGLVVSTTLDPVMQADAVQAINHGTKKLQQLTGEAQRPQGALVAIDSKTGHILALVGGNDFAASPFNRAVQAKRQPGSVFKPLIYAAAFERGMAADFMIDDKPLSIRNPDGSLWQPKNYSNRYYGRTTLADGLIYSRNIVTIKLLQKTGLQPVIKLARNAGISSPLHPELTLALGTSPVSLLEMTGAYTIFPNAGKFSPPIAITEIRDRRGEKIPVAPKGQKQVIKTATALQTTIILQDALNKGTGRKASGIPYSAGKTGTTDDNNDALFIGYTPRITTGVWVGYDREKSLGPGATGGEAAAPIWLDFMQTITGFLR
ncbi:MAG: PBP1A family penicillin-binding protein [Desulfobulbaceae bacterium]|nr:PBP1A family penicillin-binding protein [Desulfobulbaceae bacterium]